MNYNYLCDMMSGCREFSLLREALTVPYGRGRWRPCLACGLSDGAFQLFTMTLARECARGLGDYTRLLLVCSDDKEAARECELLKEAELPAFFYPAKDFNFSNITASHDFEHERLSVLCALLMTDSPMIICTTAEAALQTTIPEDVLEENTLQLFPDSAVDTEEMCRKLREAGYARVELVDGVGQFALRGGIVDVFPPADAPVRIELFGDEIDRMGSFDIMSQRFGDSIDSLIIPPVRELVLSDAARAALSETVARQLKKVSSGKSGKNPLAAEILRRELENIENSASLEFADKYIDVIYPEKTTLMSYFEGVIAIHDTAVCIERLRASGELMLRNMTEMVENNEITYSTDGNPYMEKWETLMECAERMPAVFADVFNRSYNDVAVGEIFDFTSQSRRSYASDASSLMEDLAPFVEHGYKICVLCGGETEEKSLFNVLFDEGFSPFIADGITGKEDSKYKEIFNNPENKKTPVALLCGSFPCGFEFPRGELALFDYSSEGIGKSGSRRLSAKRKKRKNTQAILSSHDLEIGDLVVHEAYGIGIYEGIENLKIDGVSRDYINIKYAGSDKLFLPVEQLDLVSKYIGAEEGVKLSKMGGADWSRSKAKAKAATKDMARELIELYARRRRTPGIAFERDDAFTRQFADAFEYEETDSQLYAIRDLTRDMERPYPMDRIICGDVGYGKTEVAMRAAFKAVASGYQVALLVPTTILAFQHFQTMSARFRGFPVSIDMLSRFRTAAQRSQSLRKLKRGETDIIIGTHRLISKDVEFKKLGLIIIDEEQRFGVAQKEKLKQLAANADVLTLTATPIPRTLNMAMGGIIDMSVLDDVPGVRSPVQTYVMEHDEEVLFEAMRRELRRGGQVFYLHNRVDSIYNVARKISEALPDARVAVGHGKLEREELEDIWDALVRGEIDILVSTTIIETGIDVPNANTLIIDRADKYGLSQLHQIRGRVGRSARKAYAYFTYPPAKVLSEVAEKRLRAIKEYASFGAGFKIATRDLEIRGAGNLLGAEQHGHMDSVGYDMYLKLLNEAVLEETGETPPPPAECAVSLRADAFIPKNYISHSGQRMEMYKKVAGITDYKDYEDVIDEFCDRFGDMPSQTLALCSISYIRALGIACRVKRIEQRGGEIVLMPDSPDPFLISKIAESYPKGALRLTLAGGCSMFFKMKSGAKPVDFTLKIMETYSEALKSCGEALENGADSASDGKKTS